MKHRQLITLYINRAACQDRILDEVARWCKEHQVHPGRIYIPLFACSPDFEKVWPVSVSLCGNEEITGGWNAQ